MRPPYLVHYAPQLLLSHDVLQVVSYFKLLHRPWECIRRLVQLSSRTPRLLRGLLLQHALIAQPHMNIQRFYGLFFFFLKALGVGIFWTPGLLLIGYRVVATSPRACKVYTCGWICAGRKRIAKSTDSLHWYLLSKEHIFLMFLALVCWDRCHGFVRLFPFFFCSVGICLRSLSRFC